MAPVLSNPPTLRIDTDLMISGIISQLQNGRYRLDAGDSAITQNDISELEFPASTTAILAPAANTINPSCGWPGLSTDDIVGISIASLFGLMGLCFCFMACLSIRHERKKRTRGEDFGGSGGGGGQDIKYYRAG